MYPSFIPFRCRMIFHRMDRPHFCLCSHQSIDIYCFHFSAIVNNAATNILMQVFMCIYVFIFLEYIPRSGIARSYGNSTFNIWRNCQTICQIGCTILHSHQKLWGFQFFHILDNTCLLSFFFSSSHPSRVWSAVSLWFWFTFPDG